MPSGIYTRTEEHRETLRKNLLQARAKRFGGQQLELVEEAPAVDGRERKHSKFVELANKRTSNVLYSMDILQKCFDKACMSTQRTRLIRSSMRSWTNSRKSKQHHSAERVETALSCRI